MSGAVPNRVKARSTVLLPERLPCQADREFGVVLEEPAAGDHVVRASQLEEQRLASSEHAEMTTPRLRSPEIDVVHLLATGKTSEVVEPVLVCDGGVCVQE